MQPHFGARFVSTNYQDPYQLFMPISVSEFIAIFKEYHLSENIAFAVFQRTIRIVFINIQHVVAWHPFSIWMNSQLTKTACCGAVRQAINILTALTITLLRMAQISTISQITFAITLSISRTRWFHLPGHIAQTLYVPMLLSWQLTKVLAKHQNVEYVARWGNHYRCINWVIL